MDFARARCERQPLEDRLFADGGVEVIDLERLFQTFRIAVA